MVPVFDPVILIADGDDGTASAVAALTQGVKAVAYDQAVDVASLGLDADSAVIASAWNLRFTADYQSEKSGRPFDGGSWNGILGDCIRDDDAAALAGTST